MFGLEEGTVIISAFIWSGCSCWKCWCFRNLAELESTVYFVIPTPQLPIDFRAFFGVYHYSYNPIHNDRRGPTLYTWEHLDKPEAKMEFWMLQMTDVPGFQLSLMFRWSRCSGFQGFVYFKLYTKLLNTSHMSFLVWDLSGSVVWKHHFPEKVGSGSLSFATQVVLVLVVKSITFKQRKSRF